MIGELKSIGVNVIRSCGSSMDVKEMTGGKLAEARILGVPPVSEGGIGDAISVCFSLGISINVSVEVVRPCHRGCVK